MTGRNPEGGTAQRVVVHAHTRKLPKKYTGPVGDRPSERAADFKAADKFKKTGTYRASIRKAYASTPIPDRKSALGQAAMKASPEGGVIAQFHNNRAASDDRQLAKYGYLVRSKYGTGKRGVTMANLGLAADTTAVKTFGKKTEYYRTAAQRKADLSALVDQTAVKAFGKNIDYLHRDDAALLPPATKQKLLTNLAKAQAAGVPAVHKGLFDKIVGKAAGTTKASALFALRQIERPGAAVASAATTFTRPSSGGTIIGDQLKAAKEGFLHPEQHMLDWNKGLEAEGVKNKWVQDPVAFAASVATDPVTFLTLGAGSVAKTGAIKAYESALRAGASEADAVSAAKKVWEGASEAERTSGVKVGLRGTPAQILSKGRTSHIQTGPIGTRGTVLLKAAARKVGATNVRPLGFTTKTLRSAANAVAPTVRPAGWDKLDWTLARRAARKARAGEREAQRHSSYRLKAYKAATKDFTPQEQEHIRAAVEGKYVDRLPANLQPVGRALEQDFANAMSQRVQHNLSQPLAPGSRVTVGPAPVAPRFATPVTKADVTASARNLSRLERRNIGAQRALRELNDKLNVNQGRAEILSRNVSDVGGEKAAENAAKVRAKALVMTGKRGTPQEISQYIDRVLASQKYAGGGNAVRLAQASLTEAEQHADSWARQLDHATEQHGLLKDEFDRQQAALKTHGKALAKYNEAPAGFYPRFLKPEDLLQPGRQTARPSELINDKSRKYTQSLANMTPEQAAKYEDRIPVATAQYILGHMRKINLSRLNDRIAALGKPVNIAPEDVEHLAGQKLELFAHEPTGLHPLFDKHGEIDKEALAHAVDNGHPIVQVDTKMAAAIRSMARGQKDWQGMPVDLAMEAHGIDDAERSGVGSFYDKQQRRLKILQTSVNPAYHIVNAIGDSFNAVIGGARPGDFAASTRLRKIESALKQADRELDPLSPTGRLHSANPLSRATKDILDKARQHVETYGDNGDLSDLDVVKLGVSHGALRTGLTSSELRAASRGAALDTVQSKSGRVMEGLQNVSDWREDLIRLTTFRGALKRGMSPDEAAEWASKHHFDYADLSPVEQRFFRRIIPFWTFTARNTPLQVRSLAARPGVFATEEKARAQSADSAGLPPDFATRLREFEQGGVPWATPLKMVLKDTELGKITAPVTIYPKLPLMDLNNIPFPQFTSAGKLAWGKTLNESGMNLLNRVTPFAKVPLEQILGINTFTGAAQQDVVQAPSWVPKELTKPFQDPRTGKMVRGISWRLLEPLQSTPITNIAGRQGTTTLNGQPSAGALRWAGWLAGPRPAVQDPRVVKINQLFDQREKLTHELNELKPQVHHAPGDQWGGKIRSKMDAITRINNRIYELSSRTGAVHPAGSPPPKGKQHKLGSGFGGGFKGGKGAGLGGGFK